MLQGEKQKDESMNPVIRLILAGLAMLSAPVTIGVVCSGLMSIYDSYGALAIFAGSASVCTTFLGIALLLDEHQVRHCPRCVSQDDRHDSYLSGQIDLDQSEFSPSSLHQPRAD